RIYVQGPNTIAALNLADGKPVWTSGEREGAESGPTRSFRGGSYRGRSQPQGAPALDQGLLAFRAAPYGGGYGGSYVLGVLDTRSGKELWRRRPEISRDGDTPGAYFNVPA